jgi:hypothetical protein
MKRALLVAVAAALAIAPAAGAKGPHAILSSGDDPVEPGRPWNPFVELVEFGDRVAHPVLIATRGDRRVAVRGLRGGSKYGFRVVFPAAGRWRLTLVDAKRRFAFPAVSVGTGDAPADYVAFPKGSMAERQGGGGVYSAPDEPPVIGRGGGSLPPETVSLVDSPSGGGFPLWILPVAGVVLAGAGIATLRARR